MTITPIDAKQFAQCQADAMHCVVDVRDYAEYVQGSEAQCCLPVNEINAQNVADFVQEQNISPEHTLVLLCARGMRAQQAAEKLQALLPNKLCVLQGGRAVLQPPNTKWSLERQVRVVAGSLVLIGIILSMLVHPVAIALSAFIGVGLIFAGITDWCGMGLLLMKMPWNK